TVPPARLAADGDLHSSIGRHTSVLTPAADGPRTAPGSPEPPTHTHRPDALSADRLAPHVALVSSAEALDLAAWLDDPLRAGAPFTTLPSRPVRPDPAPAVATVVSSGADLGAPLPGGSLAWTVGPPPAVPPEVATLPHHQGILE